LLFGVPVRDSISALSLASTLLRRRDEEPEKMSSEGMISASSIGITYVADGSFRGREGRGEKRVSLGFEPFLDHHQRQPGSICCL